MGSAPKRKGKSTSTTDSGCPLIVPKRGLSGCEFTGPGTNNNEIHISCFPTRGFQTAQNLLSHPTLPATSAHRQRGLRRPYRETSLAESVELRPRDSKTKTITPKLHISQEPPEYLFFKTSPASGEDNNCLSFKQPS